jgi:predicted nucleic acid-binding protein
MKAVLDTNVFVSGIFWKGNLTRPFFIGKRADMSWSLLLT